MYWSFAFFVNSILLGVGLAMDAFTVSLANGLRETHMPAKKMCGIAGVFAFFQALMPLIGWVCIHTIVEYFSAFEKAVPWIALTLLVCIGGKMIADGIRGGESSQTASVGIAALLLQGVATSIDALSVGFTIADYGFWEALTAAVLIAAVTFGICVGGIRIGRRFGMRFAGKAALLGGVLLILIGLEIFISGMVK